MMHQSLIKAAVSATAAMAEVQAAADYLAEAMARIHGGDWKVTVDHGDEFVMVVRRRTKRATPKQEVA